MIMFRIYLTLVVAHLLIQDQNAELLVSDEAAFMEENPRGITASKPHDEVGHPFLRRQLVSQPVCSTTSSSEYICGGPEMERNMGCQESLSSCSALPNYDCSCTGSDETSCSYCEVITPDSIACLVTGSSLTFATMEGNLKSCGCEYVGDGQVRINCFLSSVANMNETMPESTPQAPKGFFSRFRHPRRPN